jgi:hypothetical protein
MEITYQFRKIKKKMTAFIKEVVEVPNDWKQQENDDAFG